MLNIVSVMSSYVFSRTGRAVCWPGTEPGDAEKAAPAILWARALGCAAPASHISQNKTKGFSFSAASGIRLAVGPFHLKAERKVLSPEERPYQCIFHVRHQGETHALLMDFGKYLASSS